MKNASDCFMKKFGKKKRWEMWQQAEEGLSQFPVEQVPPVKIRFRQRIP